ncbi:unnamed protein product [Mycena citricolor]|uniref:Uncharacterized protein n=1 Tax=Mycena citricolor TaxID=2018698 RepID=A0AAD2JY43_9AGAR|nr:unnamed protein product [Mycena citricolor]
MKRLNGVGDGKLNTTVSDGALPGYFSSLCLVTSPSRCDRRSNSGTTGRGFRTRAK